MPLSPFAEEILLDAEHAVESGEERRIREEMEQVNKEFAEQSLCAAEHDLIIGVLREALGE